MLRGLLGGFARGRRQTSAATLVLDFLAGLNDSRITYSGGANGTRVNSSGNIVAATTPRFDYDPVTLAARGLLVEEARTNLMLRSEEFDNAAWTKIGVTVSANSIVAPSGATTADTLTQDGATNIHGVLVAAAISVTSGTVYSHSVYAKAGASTILQLTFGNASSTFTGLGYVNFNLSTGAIVGSGGTLVASGIQDAGGGWYRCFIAATATATAASNPYFVIANSAGYTRFASYTGDGTSGLYLWGAQLEAGAFPTSYIPTTSASVTRTADSAVMTGTNFSSWYNQTEGTFVCKGDFVGGAASTFPYLMVATTATPNTDVIGLLWQSNAGVIGGSIVSGGVQTYNDSAGSAKTAGSTFSAAIAYSTGGAAMASGGTLGTPDATVTLPTCDRLLIAGAARFQPVPSCHIASITYSPRRVSNTQLQALTA